MSRPGYLPAATGRFFGSSSPPDETKPHTSPGDAMRRMRMVHGWLCASLVAAALVGVRTLPAAADQLPWMNTSLSPQARAELLVSAMTLDQKIEQLHGQPGPIPELPQCGSNAGRHVPGIPALDIPTFRITNGPVGIGQGDCSPTDKATALPDSLGLAASFDPTVANQYGDLIGSEARTLGLDVVEGP